MVPIKLMIVPVFAAALLAAGPTSAQDCRRLEAMHENFLELYPTGGIVRRLTDEEARAATDALRVADGAAVIFLYSGDGPTTGARGRYLFLVIDEEDCILAHDWIDGETFDRLLPPGQ